jgi:prepilin-type processing-associated H-X9-DG protein
MRQIGVALRMYADDYEGEMPRTSHGAEQGTEAVWVLSLRPYVANAYQLRACPSDQFVDEFVNKPIAPGVPLGKYGTSYILNEYVAIPQVNALGEPVPNPEVFTGLDTVPRPAETLMVFEASDSLPRNDYWDHAHNRAWFAPSSPQARWNNILDEMEPDRHRVGYVPAPPEVSRTARRTRYDRTKGVSNFLYCDAHVKAVPAAQVRSWAFDNVNFCKPPQ